MCAIVGANKSSKFEILYQANLPRGNFASGLIGLNRGGDQMVLKKKGTINFDKVQLDDFNDYYIGHVQAPTSSKRTWSYDTSHPFESLSWSVVHNGILTNHKQIREEHVDWDVNPVDTAVIPSLHSVVPATPITSNCCSNSGNFLDRSDSIMISSCISMRVSIFS